MRTQAALAAIERIAAEVEGAVVGAGTVSPSRQVEDALTAGARFVVSPGATPRLLDDALQSGGIPFLPGVATASEIVALLEREITYAEAVPGRDRRQHQGAEGVRGTVPAGALLPTGRSDAGDERSTWRSPTWPASADRG